MTPTVKDPEHARITTRSASQTRPRGRAPKPHPWCSEAPPAKKGSANEIANDPQTRRTPRKYPSGPTPEEATANARECADERSQDAPETRVEPQPTGCAALRARWLTTWEDPPGAMVTP